MKPDYKRFTQNRQIFPRQQGYSGGLMCGHLNRSKFSANIEIYLKNRQKGTNMITSLAIAKRCLCRQEQTQKKITKEKIKKIEQNIEQTNKLIKVLQTIQIVIPKEKIEN